MELDPVVLVAAGLLAMLAALGWSAAAVFFGLWMGEKGRRRDLALLTGNDAHRRKVQDGHATIRRREPPEELAAREAEIEAVTAGLAELADAEGKSFTREELAAEARRLHQALEPTNMSA